MTIETITATNGAVITYDAYFIDNGGNTILTRNGVYVGILNVETGETVAVTNTVSTNPPTSSLSTTSIVMLAALAAVGLYMFIK